jgi:uncharacterized protein YcbX
MSSIILTQLNIYPIKSCKGISLQSAKLEERGLQYDRRWMVVDENNRFISQREMPRLSLVSVRVHSDHLTVTAPEMEEMHVPFVLTGGDSLSVAIWNDTVSAVDVGIEAATWFTRCLDTKVKLVFMPDTADRLATRRGKSSQVNFADGYPLMLLSEASLEDLNTRLEEPVPMNRFRPNLVVQGCGPYAEDTWNDIMVGGVKLHVVKPCERCAITTVNQLTAEKRKEPLRTLATYRERDGKVLFGQNLIHEGKGVVEIGSEVKIVL